MPMIETSPRRKSILCEARGAREETGGFDEENDDDEEQRNDALEAGIDEAAEEPRHPDRELLESCDDVGAENRAPEIIFPSGDESGVGLDGERKTERGTQHLIDADEDAAARGEEPAHDENDAMELCGWNAKAAGCVIVLDDGAESATECRGVENECNEAEKEERAEHERDLLHTDARTRNRNVLLIRKDRPRALLKDEKNEAIENHAERDCRHERQEAVALVEGSNEDFKRDPSDDARNHEPADDAQDERNMERLIEPLGAVPADECELSECQIEDPEHPIHERKSPREQRCK